MKVIKIGASWCSGCLVMKPRWAEIEQENPWLQTEFYDFDESSEVIERYDIGDQLPVAIFVDDDGKEMKRFNGQVGKDELLAALEEYRTR